MKKMQEQSKVIHHNFICDGCEVNPIVGVRYRCSVRPNFDLCQECEKKPQPYPMIKIRDPQQAPLNVVVSYASLPSSAGCGA